MTDSTVSVRRRACSPPCRPRAPIAPPHPPIPPSTLLPKCASIPVPSSSENSADPQTLREHHSPTHRQSSPRQIHIRQLEPRRRVQQGWPTGLVEPVVLLRVWRGVCFVSLWEPDVLAGETEAGGGRGGGRQAGGRSEGRRGGEAGLNSVWTPSPWGVYTMYDCRWRSGRAGSLRLGLGRDSAPTAQARIAPPEQMPLLAVHLSVLLPSSILRSIIRHFLPLMERHLCWLSLTCDDRARVRGRGSGQSIENGRVRDASDSLAGEAGIVGLVSMRLARCVVSCGHR